MIEDSHVRMAFQSTTVFTRHVVLLAGDQSPWAISLYIRISREY